MADGRVIVLGSINLDIQLAVTDFPSPGETVRSLSMRRGLGGKGANQAVAASRAGAATTLIGAIGDEPGVLDLLRAAAPDLDLRHITIEPDCATGTAYILVSRLGENQIVIVEGANQRLVSQGALAMERGDICLAQLEVPVVATARFFESARRAGARTVLNAAPALSEVQSLLDLADVLLVNETELARFAGGRGLDPVDVGSIIEVTRAMRGRTEQTVIVTLGANGLVVVGRESFHLPGRKVDVVDTTGAGDCFCGVFCAGLAQGLDVSTAAARANRAASLQVGRAGAADAMPWRREIV